MNDPASPSSSIRFEGKTLSARPGEPLMVTLLAHGVDVASRSVKYHRPRGAFCLDGSCGRCWMRVADVPNRPACLVPATPGLEVSRQNAFPSADHDVFRITDDVFENGFDHQRLATTSLPVLNSLMERSARRMAGLGPPSLRPVPPAPPASERSVPLLIVGGGPAGLSAAIAAQRFGVTPLLVDAHDTLGGHLRDRGANNASELGTLAAKAEQALPSSQIWKDAEAVGYYREANPPTVLIRRNRYRSSDSLVRVRPELTILAAGGYEQAHVFESNDLPGHYGLRGFAAMVRRYGVVPGHAVLILGPKDSAAMALTETLAHHGVSARHLTEAPHEEPEDTLRRVEGRTRIRWAESSSGKTIRCDIVLSHRPPAPAYELCEQAGAKLRFQPGCGFVTEIDRRTGETAKVGVFAAGELTGPMSAQNAALSGTVAGLSAAKQLRPTHEVHESWSKAAELWESHRLGGHE